MLDLLWAANVSLSVNLEVTRYVWRGSGSKGQVHLDVCLGGASVVQATVAENLSVTPISLGEDVPGPPAADVGSG